MKKKIVLSLMLIVSLFMITGCGSKKETTKKETKKEEKVEKEEKKTTKKVKEEKKEVKKEEKPKKEVKEEKKETKKTKKVDLDSMTLADLKAMAKEKGLKGYSTLKKSELIELLNK